MTTTTAIKIDLGINQLWPAEKLPPGDRRWGTYTRSFHKQTHTIDSFVEAVRRGFAFSPVMRGSHRMQSNFISAQHAVLDFDNGDETSRLTTLLAHPFIARHAAFLYSTPSSTEDKPRSRVVFVFDEPITDKDEYNRIARALTALFPTSDQTVGEAARFLYGMAPTGRSINLGTTLSLAIAKSLAAPAPLVVRPYTSRPSGPRQGRLYHVSGIRPHFTVTELISRYASRTIQNGSNPRSRWVLRCPLCTEYVEAEARSFTVAADDNVWKCFACLQFGNAYDLHVALAPEEFSPDRPHRRTQRDPDGPDSVPQEPSDWEMLTRDEEPAEPDSWESYVPKRFRQSRDDEFQPRRAKLIATLRVLGLHLAANKVGRCALWYSPLLWGHGNVELKSAHCGVVGCPNCAFVALFCLFNEKKDRLRLLSMPAVYIAQNVFILKLPSDSDEMQAALKLGHHACQGLLNRWSHRKDAPALVRNCVEAFNIRIIETAQGKVASFGVRLLANWSEQNVALLTQALQRRTPKLNAELAPLAVPVDDLPLTVSEHAFTSGAHKENLDGAIELFQKLSAVSFEWEDPEDFGVWMRAMKHAKKVHGRGLLSQVSGNKPTGKAPSAGINPETGEMDTFKRMPHLAYPAHQATRWYCDYTAQWHYRLLPGLSLEDATRMDAMPEDWNGGGM